VYGGTFSEWQGADIFIDAFARFSREHPGYRLLFIGNGSERDTLEQRARALDLAGVEFWEPIPGTELAEILASATASLASLKPGVGYDYAFASKVYASLAVGCPTIFAGPGPTVDFLRSAESVQPSGAVVAYDVAEVATALASFADAPLTAEQRRALSGWAIQNHSLEAVGDRVANLVTEVLRRTR
jgi:glycosyltransferase involved in cell wall biosynthesis